MASPIFAISVGPSSRYPKRGHNLHREETIYIKGYPGDAGEIPTSPYCEKKQYLKANSKPTNPAPSRDVNTAFITIFHTRYCRLSPLTKLTSFAASIHLYAKIYMRNWEELIKPSRIEKRLIEDFKAEHSKISFAEWSYLCSMMKKVEFQNEQVFLEFYDLIRASSNSIVPSDSFSPIRLLSDTIRSLEEAKKLYLCIYYPNYQELWGSARFLLNNTLAQSIENYIQRNPVPIITLIDSIEG